MPGRDQFARILNPNWCLRQAETAGASFHVQNTSAPDYIPAACLHSFLPNMRFCPVKMRWQANPALPHRPNRWFWLSATPDPGFPSPNYVFTVGKVNVRNRHRETPLLLAVRAGGADAVSVLLGFGARLDEPDVNGEACPVVWHSLILAMIACSRCAL